MQTNKTGNSKAAASLIVSCIAVVCSCIWQIAIMLGVLGVVLGILALRDQENKARQELAVAGIVVGSVAIAFAIVTAVLTIMIYSSLGAPAGIDTVV